MARSGSKIGMRLKRKNESGTVSIKKRNVNFAFGVNFLNFTPFAANFVSRKTFQAVAHRSSISTSSAKDSATSTS